MDVARIENANLQAVQQQPQAQVQPQAPVQQPPRQEMDQAQLSERRQGDEAGSQDPLIRAVKAVNTSLAPDMRHISINFHQPTGRTMVTVYDSETNQAIREIPPEKVLDAHAGLLELAGLLMDARG